MELAGEYLAQTVDEGRPRAMDDGGGEQDRKREQADSRDRADRRRATRSRRMSTACGVGRSWALRGFVRRLPRLMDVVATLPGSKGTAPASR